MTKKDTDVTIVSRETKKEEEMGKVIRLSKKTEKDLKELKTILIKKLDNKLDEIEQEVWEQYILPNDNQLIDVAIEMAIRQLKGS